MAFGVTSTGFVPKTLADCKAELESAFRSAFGAGINLNPPSVFATLVGLMAAREADLWALAEGVYEMPNPDAVSGASLDNICAITGTVRRPARRSLVSCLFTGTAGTVVPIRTQARVAGAGVTFQTQADFTLQAATAWATYTATAGDIRTNAGNIYRCTVGGSSTVAPTGTGSNIVDGATVRWAFVGEGAGYNVATMESVEPGSMVALAGTLAISTPVSGLRGLVNLSDATVGENEETDAALRLRRVQELVAASSSVEALATAIRAVSGVASVKVFENDTLGTVNGVPAKAFEAVVYTPAQTSALDLQIQQVIWDNKPAGIQAYGTVSGTVTDTMGFTHSVAFSRPTVKTLYVTANIKKDPALFPSDGATRVRDAILAWCASGFQLGTDVVTRSMLGSVFSVPGVKDVTNLYVGWTASPASEANLGVTARELAVADSGRIVVNATDWSETP